MLKTDLTVKELKNDYDWKEVFQFGSSPAEPNSDINCNFTIDDVKTIITADEGINDSEDWIIVVELNDGRFASLRAGCDYTGWDCRSWGDGNVAESLEKIIRFGLSNTERTRLLIPQPTD